MATKEISSGLAVQDDTVQMHKSIRSWVISFLVIGGLSIFANQTLDAVWGVILILIAVLSAKNKMPGMFIVYGVMMAWAAVNNIFSAFLGEYTPTWLFLAVAQVVWTISIFRQYRKYRHLHSTGEAATMGRFGVASTIISALILVLPPLIAIGVFAYYISLGEAAVMGLSAKIDQLPESAVAAVTSGLVDSAVLALGLAIASVACGGKKGWGTAGIVMSAIILAGMLCVYFLAVIGQLAIQQGTLPGVA